jgi:hypothetical protein
MSEGKVDYRDLRHERNEATGFPYREPEHRTGRLAGGRNRLSLPLPGLIFPLYRDPGHVSALSALPGFRTRSGVRDFGRRADEVQEAAEVLPGFETRRRQATASPLPGFGAQKNADIPGKGDTEVPGTETRDRRDSRHELRDHYREARHGTTWQLLRMPCVPRDQLFVLKLMKQDNNSCGCCLFTRKGA